MEYDIMIRKSIFTAMAVAGMVSCGSGPESDPEKIQDAGTRVGRVEPLSWWTGMKTPLQLMVCGDGISQVFIRNSGPFQRLGGERQFLYGGYGVSYNAGQVRKR